MYLYRSVLFMQSKWKLCEVVNMDISFFRLCFEIFLNFWIRRRKLQWIFISVNYSVCISYFGIFLQIGNFYFQFVLRIVCTKCECECNLKQSRTCFDVGTLRCFIMERTCCFCRRSSSTFEFFIYIFFLV